MTTALGAEGTSRQRDIALLFATRSLRMFGYGFLAVVLVLYLDALGSSGGEVGLLLALTLLGDAAISLWLTTHADRIGRRRVLVAGAALMLAAGLVFAGTPVYVVLVVAATLGVTGIARSLGVAASPLIAGPLFLGSMFTGAPFVIAGGLKIVYDLLLYRSFRALRPPEERGFAAD